MRRVLIIVMWCCFVLAVVSLVALTVLSSIIGGIELDIDVAGTALLWGLFIPPFFFVLGLNALFWSRSQGWVQSIESIAARTGAIAAVVFGLVAFSVIAVAVLILGGMFGWSYLQSALSGVG